MDWSNWVYLLTGLGIGLGSRWLVRSPRITPPAPQATAAPPEKKLKGSAHHPEVPQLLEKLKQIELDYHMASQMCEFKGGFLSRISHELRSPLNGLIGVHQLILSDLCEDPAEEREFLTQANASVQKMIQMLDQILDVSRTEHGRNPMQIENLPLAEVFEEVHYLTELQAANRNISLSVLNPHSDISIRADQRCLTQVLVNLIDLAITPATNGSILISAAPASSPPATNGLGHSKYVNIWIDLPISNRSLSEPVDLLQKQDDSNYKPEEKPNLSNGTVLLINQTLIELMQGRLEIVESPPSTEETLSSGESEFTRLQCSLPLALPE